MANENRVVSLLFTTPDQYFARLGEYYAVFPEEITYCQYYNYLDQLFSYVDGVTSIADTTVHGFCVDTCARVCECRTGCA